MTNSTERIVHIQEKEHLHSTKDVSQNVKGKTPLVIDVGSWSTRVGWASESDPRLHFESAVSKFRNRKTRQQMILAGYDCFSEPSARSSMRSPYDGCLITNIDVLENMLDFSFCKLGLKSLKENTVFATEPAVNMGPCRALVSELLFEAYNVPAVAFGVDALCAHYANSHNDPQLLKSGLVWSLGHSSVYALPITAGKLHAEYLRRLNLGGYYNSDFLLKMIQLKYPTFPIKMSHRQAQFLVENECFVSENYIEDLRSLTDKSTLEERTTIVQFPYTVPEGPSKEEIEAAELRKQEQVRRMKEQVANQRLNRLAEKQSVRDQQAALLASLADNENDDELLAQLEDLGFNSAPELAESVKRLESAIRKLQAQINGEPINEEDENEQPKAPPVSDLVNIPDAELSEELRVQKRRQKLLLAGWEARERMRKEKEAKLERDRLEAEALEQERLADPIKWLAEKHARRKVLLERREQRQKLLELKSNRRSQVAQSRMRSLAALAADDNLTTTAGNRRKARNRRNAGSDDDFGADDSDWNVYHDIQGTSSLQELQDEENEELERIENLLIEHDPTFTEDDIINNTDSAEAAFHDSIIYALRNGVPRETPHFESETEALAYEIKRAHQLRLNVERTRVPETLFEPGVTGIDQSGLVETTVEIFIRYSPASRLELLGNVFFTGGVSLFPHLTSRFQSDLRPYYPQGTVINVRRAKDPILDPWRGASLYASDAALLKHAALSRKRWEECGHHYLQEFSLSNRFFDY